MKNLNLPNPKMMDVAVPANMHIGLAQDAVAAKGWALSPEQTRTLLAADDVVLVDLREKRERERHGRIPGAIHAPYPMLGEEIGRGGLLHELARDKRIVFFCAYGERSAMAVQAAHDAGLNAALHLQGGIAAWKNADGPIEA